jgi:16S rRNA (guanine527-N7)-methyltransferase
MKVSRETILCKLEIYKNLLKSWNKKINLTSKNIDLNLHIKDCLQLAAMIDSDESVIDIASGNGMPGLILAISGIKDVTLVESNYKKAVFLLHASSVLGNKVNVVNKRAEDISGQCEVLTSKAFSSMQKLLSCTVGIKVNSRYLLQRGGYRIEEDMLISRNRKLSFFLHQSIAFQNCKILELRNANNCRN